MPILLLEEELWMSTSTWGEPEPLADEMYPPTLLKIFLKQMMAQFGGDGACMALYDESSNQMKIHEHIQLRRHSQSPDLLRPTTPSQANHLSLTSEMRLRQGRRTTVNLFQDGQHSPSAQANSGSLWTSPIGSQSTYMSDEIEDVVPQPNGLFPVGTSYPLGHDLIGFVWQKNEAYSIRHEDYLSIFANLYPSPFYVDITPSAYLAVPIRETTLIEELNNQKPRASILGVVVLYQIAQNSLEANPLHKHRAAAQYCVERIALYLQNHRLQRAQRRTSEYLQLLQNISTAFPSSVKLCNLVEHVYQFVLRVVDVSSMLLTLHDRDLKRLYDVFAL